MPRKTPIKELQAEDPRPGSPVRRSSRISLRRTSTEATVSTPVSTPTSVKTRRSSLTQESTETPKESKPAPRGRRASTSKIDDVTKPTPEIKGPITRRRSASFDVDDVPSSKSAEEAKPGRKGRSSITKSDEPLATTPVKKVSPSQPVVTLKPIEETDLESLEASDVKTNLFKKNKKNDLNLSVINEGEELCSPQKDQDTSKPSPGRRADLKKDAKSHCDVSNTSDSIHFSLESSPESNVSLTSNKENLSPKCNRSRRSLTENVFAEKTDSAVSSAPCEPMDVDDSEDELRASNTSQVENVKIIREKMELVEKINENVAKIIEQGRKRKLSKENLNTSENSDIETKLDKNIEPNNPQESMEEVMESLQEVIKKPTSPESESPRRSKRISEKSEGNVKNVELPSGKDGTLEIPKKVTEEVNRKPSPESIKKTEEKDSFSELPGQVSTENETKVEEQEKFKKYIVIKSPKTCKSLSKDLLDEKQVSVADQTENILTKKDSEEKMSTSNQNLKKRETPKRLSLRSAKVDITEDSSKAPSGNDSFKSITESTPEKTSPKKICSESPANKNTENKIEASPEKNSSKKICSDSPINEKAKIHIEITPEKTISKKINAESPVSKSSESKTEISPEKNSSKSLINERVTKSNTEISPKSPSSKTVSPESPMNRNKESTLNASSDESKKTRTEKIITSPLQKSLLKTLEKKTSEHITSPTKLSLRSAKKITENTDDQQTKEVQSEIEPDSPRNDDNTEKPDTSANGSPRRLDFNTIDDSIVVESSQSETEEQETNPDKSNQESSPDSSMSETKKNSMHLSPAISFKNDTTDVSSSPLKRERDVTPKQKSPKSTKKSLKISEEVRVADEGNISSTTPIKLNRSNEEKSFQQIQYTPYAGKSKKRKLDSDNDESPDKTYKSVSEWFESGDETEKKIVVDDEEMKNPESVEGSEVQSNDFIDDMAEEGEEDIPSEDENEIIDKGEDVGFDDTSDASSIGSYEYDSFIEDDEVHELLSGEEYDLTQKKKKKKKTRIINVDDADEDEIIKIPKKLPPPKKRCRIRTPSSSSSSSDIEILDMLHRQDKDIDTDKEIVVSSPSDKALPSKTENFKSEEVIEVVTSKNEVSEKHPKEEPRNNQDCVFSPNGMQRNKRSNSLIIHENVKVSDIKNQILKDRIDQAVNLFCSGIKEKVQGNVDFEVSFDYKSSDCSPAAEASEKRKTKKHFQNKAHLVSYSSSNDESESNKSISIVDIIEPSQNTKDNISKSNEIISVQDLITPSENSFQKKNKKKNKSSSAVSIPSEVSAEDSETQLARSSKRRRDHDSSSSAAFDVSSELTDEVFEEPCQIGKKTKLMTKQLSKSEKRPTKISKLETKSKPKSVSLIRKKRKNRKPWKKVEEVNTLNLLNEAVLREKKAKKELNAFAKSTISDWVVEGAGSKIKPSSANLEKIIPVKVKQLKCTKSELPEMKFHPKDFKNRMIYDSERVKRVETKKMLKKRGG